MGIFNRSKNKPANPLPQPATEYQYLPQSSYSTAYGPQPLQHWSKGPERPQTSQGQQYGPPSPGWIYPTPLPYQPCQQVFVSNYLLTAPQPRQPKSTGKKSKCKLKSSSVTNLPKLQGDLTFHIPKTFNEELSLPACISGARISNEGVLPPSFIWGAQIVSDGLPVWKCERPESDTLYNLISSKLDAVVTLIDGEKFSGDDKDLWVSQPEPMQNWERQIVPTNKNTVGERLKGKSKGETGCPIATATVNKNYFTKVNLYANSKLPLDLPFVKLYVPTYPLLCVAAKYSEQVYSKPSSKEREAHVDGDWRMGTKAMVIKSVPRDDMNVIVFAIRGTQTFLDWAVNLNSVPSAPTGFLDDPGNLCHTGFLSVARKMVKPVAARLRFLLEEDPRRSACSLLITGHSAGGAVAALIYSHMLATTQEASSELNILTTCFKRVHCVTFGAPPVSLLPLSKPADPAIRKSLFLSFVNEGDPVARAEKAYVRSLLDLYVHPAPSTRHVPPQKLHPTSNNAAGASTLSLHKPRPSRPTCAKLTPENYPPAPVWPIPPATLSNAGRLILLRSVPRPDSYSRGKKGNKMDDGVQARSITDEQLRGVVWGDPVCHMMKHYTRRVEVLATNAVVGRG